MVESKKYEEENIKQIHRNQISLNHINSNDFLCIYSKYDSRNCYRKKLFLIINKFTEL